jgi:hypothetical protein
MVNFNDFAVAAAKVGESERIAAGCKLSACGGQVTGSKVQVASYPLAGDRLQVPSYRLQVAGNWRRAAGCLIAASCNRKSHPGNRNGL